MFKQNLALLNIQFWTILKNRLNLRKSQTMKEANTVMGFTIHFKQVTGVTMHLPWIKKLTCIQVEF